MPRQSGAAQEYVGDGCDIPRLLSARLVFSKPCWCLMNGELFFLLVGVVCAERGIYILYDDVKSCQCEDVHVLWSILVE